MYSMHEEGYTFLFSWSRLSFTFITARFAESNFITCVAVSKYELHYLPQHLSVTLLLPVKALVVNKIPERALLPVASDERERERVWVAMRLYIYSSRETHWKYSARSVERIALSNMCKTLSYWSGVSPLKMLLPWEWQSKQRRSYSTSWSVYACTWVFNGKFTVGIVIEGMNFLMNQRIKGAYVWPAYSSLHQVLHNISTTVYTASYSLWCSKLRRRLRVHVLASEVNCSVWCTQLYWPLPLSLQCTCTWTCISVCFLLSK